MWFKNITLFQLREPFTLTVDELEEKLSQSTFRPCLSQQMLSDGWVAPLGRKAAQLVHVTDGCMMLCLQIEEKVLPAAVIKENLNEKLFEIEEKDMRKVGRREKERLRDEIMLDLLPRAFTRSRKTYGYIDPRSGWLLIDSASPKGVEEFTEVLRETLGTLPITPPILESTPAVIMTNWLESGLLPSDIELADECEMRDGDGVVQCKGQDLFSEEIRGHLQAGKQVTKLALSWDNRLSIVLTDDLIIRRLQFTDLVQEQLKDTHTDGDEGLFDAQFALMIGELRLFLPRVLDWFDSKPVDYDEEPIKSDTVAEESVVDDDSVDSTDSAITPEDHEISDDEMPTSDADLEEVPWHDDDPDERSQ